MGEAPSSALNANRKKIGSKLNKLGLYIHIPFCRRKCPYCDFYSVTLEKELKDRYMVAIYKEIKFLSQKFMPHWQADSLYFGGGTPSLLHPGEVEKMINFCQRHFNLTEGAEITLEANPDTVNWTKLKGYRSAGVNRLSLGIQSFNNEELKLLGRLHSCQKALRAYEQTCKAGFENINLDLMIGLPHQKLEQWQSSLKQAAQLKPQHFSTYILQIKDESYWGKEPPSALPSEELIEEMYYWGIDFLTGEGYRHYEISNFALPDFLSYHNLKYWSGGAYLGLGAAAHSCDGKFRYNNPSDVYQYIQLIERFGSAWENKIALSPKMMLEEALFLGLRKTEGLELKPFQQKYGIDILNRFSQEISRLCDAGLIEISNGFVKLSRKGLLLSNEVFQAFLLD